MKLATVDGRLRLVPGPESEAHLQERLVRHIRARLVPGAVFFAVPNGGKRQAREAAALRRQGVVPGVPDLLFLCCGVLHGLELKTAKGKASEAQKDMLRALGAAHARVAIAHGFDEAVECLDGWGLLLPANNRKRG